MVFIGKRHYFKIISGMTNMWFFGKFIKKQDYILSHFIMIDLSKSFDLRSLQNTWQPSATLLIYR